jgi:hypothetical protein
MFLRAAGSRFRTTKGVRMGRHVDAKPRLTVVRSALSLAFGVSLLMSGAAQAAATVQSFGYPPTAFSGPLPADPTTCGMGNDDGFITGTDELSGQFTETDNGIAVHGTETTIVRVDLPATSVYGGGSYILGTAVAHFAFAAHGPVTTFTNTTNDYGDVIYNAAGEVIGSTTFHLVEHFTLFDLGAPGPSPEDKVVVNFERWRLTCP